MNKVEDDGRVILMACLNNSVFYCTLNELQALGRCFRNDMNTAKANILR